MLSTHSVFTFPHYGKNIKVVQIFLEPRFEVGQTDWLKAWEARVEHELSQVEQLVCVPSDCQEALDYMTHEELVSLCLPVATQNVDELFCEFEIG